MTVVFVVGCLIYTVYSAVDLESYPMALLRGLERNLFQHHLVALLNFVHADNICGVFVLFHSCSYCTDNSSELFRCGMFAAESELISRYDDPLSDRE